MTVLVNTMMIMQASPCFRTGGSVPVPALAKEKVKRRIKLHRYKEESAEEISLEVPQSFTVTETASLETRIEESKGFEFLGIHREWLFRYQR